MTESVDGQVPVSSLLASLAHTEHQVQEEPRDEDVDEAARAWELTPTEAFLEGKAAGLAQAQQEVREKAGWPVEKQSHRE
ncbi:MAG TPA: hypothetical protein VHZ97_30705 [Pseudonocardiaceae bacterium]|jgi:hypothetical protein|nr:hypothetical protein [Pseudonocardiaceae bacterium]